MKHNSQFILVHSFAAGIFIHIVGENNYPKAREEILPGYLKAMLQKRIEKKGTMSKLWIATVRRDYISQPSWQEEQRSTRGYDQW
jgi:hypothetical protein